MLCRSAASAIESVCICTAQECKHAHGTLEGCIGTRMRQDGNYTLEVLNPNDGAKGEFLPVLAPGKLPILTSDLHLLPTAFDGPACCAASQVAVDSALKIFTDCFGARCRPPSCCSDASTRHSSCYAVDGLHA